ncbi:MAG: hypothetical protein SF069_03800 [Phycisphaerae bacterium]|nr:hypothetical protein [Phycisphaerae bacterium]
MSESTRPAHLRQRALRVVDVCRVVGGALLLLAFVLPMYSCRAPFASSSAPANTPDYYRPVEEFFEIASLTQDHLCAKAAGDAELTQSTLQTVISKLQSALALWTANLAMGLAALLWRPRARTGGTLAAGLIVALHALRWPIASVIYAWECSVSGTAWSMQEFIAPSTVGSGWTAYVAPLLTLHAAFLLWRVGGGAVAPALLFWSAWVLAVLHDTFSLSDWPGLWLAPLKGDFESVGVLAIWLGAVLVGVAAGAKIWAEAPSIRAAIAMVLWGWTPPIDPTRCAVCDYSLVALTSGRCPECGTSIPSSSRSTAA